MYKTRIYIYDLLPYCTIVFKLLLVHAPSSSTWRKKKKKHLDLYPLCTWLGRTPRSPLQDYFFPWVDRETWQVYEDTDCGDCLTPQKSFSTAGVSSLFSTCLSWLLWDQALEVNEGSTLCFQHLSVLTWHHQRFQNLFLQLHHSFNSNFSTCCVALRCWAGWIVLN